MVEVKWDNVSQEFSAENVEGVIGAISTVSIYSAMTVADGLCRCRRRIRF